MIIKEYYISESDKILCPCCGRGFDHIDNNLFIMFKDLREYLGVPLHIESGFRCKKHNDELRERGYNASKTSLHLQGKAFDIMMTYEQRKTCIELYNQNKIITGGLGIYRWGVHIDTGKKRNWFYR